MYQKKGKLDRSLHNSTMEMIRVTVKQKHQLNMDQLPMSLFSMPMLTTSKKATRVVKSCGRRRKWHTWTQPSRSGDVHLVDMAL